MLVHWQQMASPEDRTKNAKEEKAFFTSLCARVSAASSVLTALSTNLETVYDEKVMCVWMWVWVCARV